MKGLASLWATTPWTLSMLWVLDGDGVGQPDVAGPTRNGATPESIPFVASRGRFRVR